jgi:hypothetical protein
MGVLMTVSILTCPFYRITLAVAVVQHEFERRPVNHDVSVGFS